MPDDSPAAEVAFDEYPNVDFTPRFPFPTPSTNGHAHTAVKPSRRLSIWRALRKLVRQRQESAVVKSVKWQWRDEVSQLRSAADKESAILNKRIENRDKALNELQQKMDRTVDQLKETIASREKDIKNHVELEIPKLKRELQVAYSHIDHLEKLVEKKLSYEEMQLALYNKSIVDSETAGEQLVRQTQMMERGR